MKKINTLWIILKLIFLIVFNSLFFLIGGIEHNASVWISYGFIHFAYIMLLLTPRLISEGNSSSIFGLTLYSISAGYFLIEIIIGTVFIIFSPEGYKAALLVQFCIAGLYGILLITNMIANRHTADAENDRQHQIAYVKNASTKLKGMLDRISDKEAKKNVERVYDAVYSSPIKSHPSFIQMENRIIQYINELEDAVSAGNKENIISLANTLLLAINERNMQLQAKN
jgi:hypothetical protein